MDINDARRQITEITSIQGQAKYSHAIEINTPALFNRLEKAVGSSTTTSSNVTLPVKKCISLNINCRELDDINTLLSGVILEIELPLDYPSSSSCRIIHATNNGVDITDGIDTKISNYLASFVGCECLELVIDWLHDNKDTCLLPNDKATSNNDALQDVQRKVECFILRYNHLLSGSEHKKEKAMVDTAKKHKLQGGLLWGTPGIVVVVPPSSEDDAKDYGVQCRELGKRPDGVESFYLPKDGIEEAELGGLAQQKRGGKLKDMDTATLRKACGGDEELLRAILGVK